MAATALTQFLREQLGAMGLVLTFGLLAFYLVGLLWIMEKLPHRGSDWRDLLPGAVLVALGRSSSTSLSSSTSRRRSAVRRSSTARSVRRRCSCSGSTSWPG